MSHGLGPGRALVAHKPCDCAGGHTTWTCLECGGVVYAPPATTGCQILAAAAVQRCGHSRAPSQPARTQNPCHDNDYARIADEYFAVTEKVEALYDQPPTRQRRRGPRMRKLRAEMHRRMLGNGYCARPVEMTATSNRSANRAASRKHHRVPPTLQRQRDDARRKSAERLQCPAGSSRC